VFVWKSECRSVDYLFWRFCSYIPWMYVQDKSKVAVCRTDTSLFILFTADCWHFRKPLKVHWTKVCACALVAASTSRALRTARDQ